MLSRTSHVKQITIKSVVFSSNLQIGDTKYIDAASAVLAMQVPEKEFIGDSLRYEDYPVFNFRSPLPVLFEDFPMVTFNHHPRINVDEINIIGVSTSAIVAIGNTDHVRSSTRVLNIINMMEEPASAKGG
ncbi:MAG: spore germination protein GerPE [Bacillus sp. (in: firmicutes)]